MSELSDKVTLKFNEQTTWVEAPGYHIIRGPNAAGLFFSNYAYLQLFNNLHSCD